MISRSRISIIAALAFACLCGLQAAQNVGTVNGVAIDNVGTVNGVAIDNVGTIQGVDNTAGGGSSVTTADSDNFNRADASPAGGEWSIPSGFGSGLNIVSNRLEAGATSTVCAVVEDTATANSNQWFRVVVNQSNTAYALPMLRFTDGASPFYEIQLSNPSAQIVWNRVASAGGSATAVQSASFDFPDSTDYVVCGTITGTGAATEVRVWINPTGDAAEPTNASNWGGDTTPDATFTNDPASPVDTGLYFGLGAYQYSAANVIYDDPSFGSL